MTVFKLEKSLIDISISCFALYLLLTVYFTFWKRKNVANTLWWLYCLMTIFCLYFLTVLANPLANFFCVWVLYLLGTQFFHATICERIIIALTMVTVDNLSEHAVGFLLSHLFNQNFSLLLETNLLFYLCRSIISKMLIFLIVRIACRLYWQRTLSLSLSGILPTLLLPFSSVLLGFVFMKISPLISSKNLELITTTVFLLLITSQLYFVYVAEKQSEQERTKQLVFFLEAQNRTQFAHYQELYQGQQRIRKIRHDIKNILLALSGMIRAGDIEKALEQIAFVSGELDTASMFVQTGIPALDAVISAKLSQAKEKDISFYYQISLPPLKIDEIDFCVLMASALDNALESCCQITSPARKYIALKIHICGLYLLCTVENSCPSETEGFSTSKADRENHGFGLANMKKITEQYGGSLNLEIQNGIFKVSILLKNR